MKRNTKMKNFSSYLIFLACILVLSCNTNSQKNLKSEKKVYLEYTEAGLDSAYAQSYWAPNRKYVFSQLRSLIEFSKSRIGDPERIQYGRTDAEQLDLYTPNRKNAPIHILFMVEHGVLVMDLETMPTMRANLLNQECFI